MLYTHFPRNVCYMNLETCEIMIYKRMIKEAAELYDFDDWTNAVELWEYYDTTDIPVSAIA